MGTTLLASWSTAWCPSCSEYQVPTVPHNDGIIPIGIMSWCCCTNHRRESKRIRLLILCSKSGGNIRWLPLSFRSVVFIVMVVSAPSNVIASMCAWGSFPSSFSAATTSCLVLVLEHQLVYSWLSKKFLVCSKRLKFCRTLFHLLKSKISSSVMFRPHR